MKDILTSMDVMSSHEGIKLQLSIYALNLKGYTKMTKMCYNDRIGALHTNK